MDRPITDFAMVMITWAKGMSRDSYCIAKEDIDQFFDAFIELHYSPGRNPYNNKETARIIDISACAVTASGPYWWTTRGLGTVSSTIGVKVYGHGYDLIKRWFINDDGEQVIIDRRSPSEA